MYLDQRKLRDRANMEKASSCEKNIFKKGAWSEEEDEKLRTYIQRYGHWNWGLLPKFAGLSRSGKSCRLRWMNYLRPNMKHGNFTIEEDNMIIDLHNKLGNKWSAIAANLPGRSDNEIKNRWNTNLKKRVQEDQTMLQTIEPNQANPKQNPNLTLLQEEAVEMLLSSEYSPSSSNSSNELSSCWFDGLDYVLPSDNEPQTYELTDQDFWNEPFLPNIASSVDNMLSPLNMIDDLVPQSSSQDMMMMMINHEFSWSMSDSYAEYNSLDCWDSIQ